MFRMDGEDHSMLVLSIRRVAQALAPRERPGCQQGASRVGGTSNVAGSMQPQMERRKQPQIDADERRSDGTSTALATEGNGLDVVVHRRCAVVCVHLRLPGLILHALPIPVQRRLTVTP
ncbi:MAG: hypothetical protein ACYS9X_13520 [Planctomycetota bacterium]|jgi:hypothetical protein